MKGSTVALIFLGFLLLAGIVAAGLVAFVRNVPSGTGGGGLTGKPLPSKKEVAALIGRGDHEDLIALLGRPLRITRRTFGIIGHQYHYRNACYDPIAGRVVSSTVVTVTGQGGNDEGGVVVEVAHD